jgi:hypothetical protein
MLYDELGVQDVSAGLKQLRSMLEKVAGDVERSKAKDDERGTRIIEDYARVHVEANQDPVVQHTWAETRRLQREIDQLLARIQTRGQNQTSSQHSIPASIGLRQ